MNGAKMLSRFSVASLAALVTLMAAIAQAPAQLMIRTSPGGGNGGGGFDPANALFFDDFNYEVGRLDDYATKSAAFAAGGGYIEVLDNAEDPGAGGYFYTVSSIEGDATNLRGSGGRALAMESRAGTVQYQGDITLRPPVPTSVSPWPSDIWMQFWLYVQRDARSGKLSDVVGRHTKFMYPLVNGNTSWPSGATWILGLAGEGLDVLEGDGQSNYDFETPGAYTFYIAPAPEAVENGGDPRAIIQRIVGSGTPSQRLYPNLVPVEKQFFLPNIWYLLRWHVKHDGAVDSNTSEYHMWVREYGTPSFTKYSEYIGGATDPLDFEFYNREDDSDGIRGLRFPTTMGSPAGPWGDTWIYMDDLAFTDSEEDLPTSSLLTPQTFFERTSNDDEFYAWGLAV
jgi:hypothetical protein